MTADLNRTYLNRTSMVPLKMKISRIQPSDAGMNSVITTYLPTRLITLTVQTFNSCSSRPDVRQCLVVQIIVNNMSKNKPSTLMTHVACESKLLSVVRSFMHQGPRIWVAIGHAVVYHARAAHAFSAGNKCRHCRLIMHHFL